MSSKSNFEFNSQFDLKRAGEPSRPIAASSVSDIYFTTSSCGGTNTVQICSHTHTVTHTVTQSHTHSHTVTQSQTQTHQRGANMQSHMTKPAKVILHCHYIRKRDYYGQSCNYRHYIYQEIRIRIGHYKGYTLRKIIDLWYITISYSLCGWYWYPCW